MKCGRPRHVASGVATADSTAECRHRGFRSPLWLPHDEPQRLVLPSRLARLVPQGSCWPAASGQTAREGVLACRMARWMRPLHA
jgi:hypothetical protein